MARDGTYLEVKGDPSGLVARRRQATLGPAPVPAILEGPAE